MAVLGSVLASIYRTQLTSHLHSLHLSADLQARALSSVTGGFQVAHQSGSATLLNSVQGAFIDGISRASLVAALACLAGAIVVAFALPARGSALTTGGSGSDGEQAEAGADEGRAQLVVG